MRNLVLLILLAVSPVFLNALVWQVGPTRTYKYCSQIKTLVQNNDTIEIDAATYTNDVQVAWTKNNLLIRGVNGRPVLIAGSSIANDMSNGKGIFVVDGTNTTIENIEFRDCKVQSFNGAGIRIENSNVVVRNCVFNGNEMGILAGGTIPNCTILVEYSEFLNGGSVANPGYQHNIYINHIDTFIFRYNYSHDAIAEGHEVKSRATFNLITYNRLANISSVDSRTIDLPNGGVSVIMGNIIEQGMNSSNSNLIGYGLEGLINTPPHNIWVVNNTFINRKDKGSFVQVISSGMDTFMLVNNILAGPKTGGLFIGTPAFLDSSNNLVNDQISVVGFENLGAFNYHLLSTSMAINQGRSLTKKVNGHLLVPTLMYKDSLSKESRPQIASIDIGAFEYAPSSGMSQISSQQLNRIYPNPCTDQLWIEEPYEALQILNMKGEECLFQINQSGSLNLSMLPPGVYTLQLQQKQQTQFHRLLIY